MEDYEFVVEHEGHDITVLVEGETVTIFCIHDIINQDKLLDQVGAIIAARTATLH